MGIGQVRLARGGLRGQWSGASGRTLRVLWGRDAGPAFSARMGPWVRLSREVMSSPSLGQPSSGTEETLFGSEAKAQTLWAHPCPGQAASRGGFAVCVGSEYLGTLGLVPGTELGSWGRAKEEGGTALPQELQRAQAAFRHPLPPPQCVLSSPLGKLRPRKWNSVLQSPMRVRSRAGLHAPKCFLLSRLPPHTWICRALSSLFEPRQGYCPISDDKTEAQAVGPSAGEAVG